MATAIEALARVEDSGGPAFPTENAHQSGATLYHYEGMSLRDYLAAKALQGMLANPINAAQKLIEDVELSYEYADAMLAARALIPSPAPQPEPADDARAVVQNAMDETDSPAEFVKRVEAELRAKDKKLAAQATEINRLTSSIINESAVRAGGEQYALAAKDAEIERLNELSHSLACKLTRLEEDARSACESMREMCAKALDEMAEKALVLEKSFWDAGNRDSALRAAGGNLACVSAANRLRSLPIAETGGTV